MKHKRPPNRTAPEQLRITSERRNWLSCRSDCEDFAKRATLPRTMREAFEQVASSLGPRIAAEIGDLISLSNTPDNWHGLLRLLDHPALVRDLSRGTCAVMRVIRETLVKHEFKVDVRKPLEVPAEAMAAARAVVADTFGD